MKTLLVATDFSAAADHTLQYANQLAARLQADIVLVHCTHGSGQTEQEKTVLQLHNLAERMRYQRPVRQGARKIRYRYEALEGCLHDHAPALVEKYRIALMVLSLEHTDCGEPAANANHAIRIIEEVGCPVLIVPPGAKRLPARLVYAVDFTSFDETVFGKLLELVKSLNARLFLVQTYEHQNLGQLSALKKAVSKIRIRYAEEPVEFHLLAEEDALEGISEFCARVQADMLVVAHQDCQLVTRLSDIRYLKTQAYHTRIPVLSYQLQAVAYSCSL
jgi:nucleotide-binding universal stress UspA family protein